MTRVTMRYTHTCPPLPPLPHHPRRAQWVGGRGTIPFRWFDVEDEHDLTEKITYHTRNRPWHDFLVRQDWILLVELNNGQIIRVRFK